MVGKWLFYLICLALAAGVLSLLTLRLLLPETLQLFSMAMLAFLAAAVLAAAAAITTLVYLLQHKPVSAQLLTSIILGLTPVAIIAAVVGNRFHAPLIHDISTDWVNPPGFEYAAADRAAGSNGLAPDPTSIALQKQHYPEIKPLYLPLQTDQAIAAVEGLLNEYDWQILGRNEDPYRIEAVARTTIFGFKDDMIIRILPTDNGVRVDMRSASRVGKGDFAANALRIQAFINELEARVKSRADRLDSTGRAS